MADFGTIQIVYVVLVNQWPLIAEDHLTVNASSVGFSALAFMLVSACVTLLSYVESKLNGLSDVTRDKYQFSSMKCKN